MLLNAEKYWIYIIAAAIIFIVFNKSSLCQSTDYDGEIKYSLNGSHLNIEGLFNNLTASEVELSYHLNVAKQSKTGNSSTNQSGVMKIPAGSIKTLSRSNVDYEKDAVYKVHLIVKSGQITLADKELELKGSEIQKH